ncbi:thiamine phosphate synthase [Sphingomonas sp. BK580]|uniref:thiamine phosphate synthase n=1 Tax=Sphingomonas sp. BK580 TaxID=2586972 RepID=UPI0017C9E58D|nr:thiamine phosphate synthase [Sphingomonas sp. BK580]MBB3693857.1 thiamine-phosphate pyrophosphorylase [Sphingomonas sp. BK580]
MRARHPDRWLMTDERQGEALWRALGRLPRGGGIVFRHHATPPAERARLFARVAAVARRRGLILVRAGATPLRGERGRHARRGPGLVTWPAHSRPEAIMAVRAGAALVFVSPVFATRSHPGARALGPLRAAAIARGLPLGAIALGGVDERRYRHRLRALGFGGYAAIDAWGAGDG